MGNEQDIYIGAYLELDLIPEEVKYYTFECRTHPDVKYDNDKVKYCSRCGRKLKKVRHISEKYPDYDELSKDDTFMPIYINNFPNQKMILVSNMNSDNTHFNIRSNTEGIIDIQDHNYYISNMYKKYHSQIQALADHDRVSSLVYKFGIVVHWW